MIGLKQVSQKFSYSMNISTLLGEELLKFTRACESFHKEFEINATDFNTWKNSIVLPFLEHNGIDISKA